MTARRPRIAVIRFPGMNCEEETRRALEAHGLSSDVFMWNGPTDELLEYDGYVLPGGFSYQDRVRAGAIAAKDPVVECVFEQAQSGKPVVGICNGAQILLESGFVPGIEPGVVQMGLARNVMPGRDGYYTRWTHCEVASVNSCATCAAEAGQVLPIPIAHAEGRFVTATDGLLDELEERGQIVLRYAHPGGGPTDEFPWNPNGSAAAIAAVSNPRGNVVAMMPHPERSSWLFQVPVALPGVWGKRRRDARGDDAALARSGPGGLVMESLRRFVVEGNGGRP